MDIQQAREEEMLDTPGTHTPTIEECIAIITDLAKATRSQATATGKESMIVKMARKRAERFLWKCGE